jgi:ascorbate-specific PTS system EIIC-type component UlaA
MVGVQTAVAGQQLLTCLTDLTNTILSGHVPKVVTLFFCGAIHPALSKKDGGIRPIAVGCTLHRLVAKAASSAVRDRVIERL